MRAALGYLPRPPPHPSPAPPPRSCFCDDGYLSTDCAVIADPFPSGSVAGALFGGMIITAGVMLGVAFYLARRSKATSSVDGFYGQVAGA